MKQIVFFFFLLISMGGFAQSEEVMVLNAIEETKSLIAQKQYSNAQGRLEDMRVFGVYTDSIDYYMKVIDYHIELDSVEVLYQKKRFKEARSFYDAVAARYKNISKPFPKWILRCDTIIEAQKRGEAVSESTVFERRTGSEEIVISSEKVDFYKGKSPLLYLRNGKIVLESDYNYGCPFSENLSAVRKGGLTGSIDDRGEWGFVSQSGTNVIKCQYSMARSFSEGLACVIDKNGKRIYIDKQGNVVINEVKDNSNRNILWGIFESPDYYCKKKRMNWDFSEGLAYAHSVGRYGGFFSKEGRCKILLKRRYKGSFYSPTGDNGIRPFSCGRSIVSIDVNPKNQNQIVDEDHPIFKYGYIDKRGEEIIPLEYDYAYDFHEGKAWVRKGEKYGCIDVNGGIVVDFEYDSDCEDCVEYKYVNGYARVKKKGKWGFVDNRGKPISSFEFDDADDFEENFASVKKGNRWGLIDRFGTTTFDYDN